MDFRTLNMMELCNLRNEVNNEIEKRKKDTQRQDWENLVKAIKDYTKEYGEIYCNVSYISYDCDFSDIDEIYEEQ